MQSRALGKSVIIEEELSTHDMLPLEARTYRWVLAEKSGIYRVVTVPLAINRNEKQVTEEWPVHESLS